MSVPKWIVIGSLALFSIIGVSAFFKKAKEKKLASNLEGAATVVIDPIVETQILSVPSKQKLDQVKSVEKTKNKKLQTLGTSSLEGNSGNFFKPIALEKDDFPNIDRIFQLFSLGSSKLPIVETITYSSSVSWLKGRPAWVADYALHFNTSRHFIARSLNGKPDYFSQKVVEGSSFNVFRKDKQIQFYLLVDVSRCKMGFYYVDLNTNERVLLKTYRVGLGRKNASRPSGTLTPLGRYSLGGRVAIYKPGTQGIYLDQKQEMIRVFGTRWIPFEEELERVSAPAKGYGLQGAPWIESPVDHETLVEYREVIGAYESDGCIRLASEDIEELFAIVITKPTFIEIVKDFHEAKLPGIEVATPSR